MVNLLMTTGMHVDRTIGMKLEWYSWIEKLRTTEMLLLFITSKCTLRVRIRPLEVCSVDLSRC